jgi:hypothetical protein
MLLLASRLRGLLIASKPHILSVANTLHTFLIASKPRMLLLANRLRGLLPAYRLRTLLISGAILLFVVLAAPVGLLIYSSSKPDEQPPEQPETVVCDMKNFQAVGTCMDPYYKTVSVVVCELNSKGEIVRRTCEVSYEW